MRDGFIKVAAGIPELSLANIDSNTESIKKIIAEADKQGVNLLTLPELCITGYTCGDLFFSDILIEKSLESLIKISAFTKDKYPVVIVGVPIKFQSALYNCAAVLCRGKIIGIIPKINVPNHAEFYEERQFSSGISVPKNTVLNINSLSVPFGTDIIFSHNELSEYTFAAEICEDLWALEQPSQQLCANGAAIIVNPSASNEIIGKAKYRKDLVTLTSARELCGYVFVSSSVGESVGDTVFSSHSLICENGTTLAENKPFGDKTLLVSEIDVKKLSHERQINSSFNSKFEFTTVRFEQEITQTELTRKFERNPFVPTNDELLSTRAEEILQIQSQSLARRLSHTFAKKAVIGISGGLDSTLALLVAARAMKILKRPASDILAITMPGLGTTKRTRSNSEILCGELGVTFKEINITSAVKQHFSDIGQSETDFDVTYENSQARERTQVLMDIANKENGLVVGTGDLSELALGWATYNGDHMSMYAVNAGVPKTLVRYVVAYEAETPNANLRSVLLDILDTPVSPELLPANDKGDIAQKTEDLVGPYELHDFFLYNVMRYGMAPKKLFRLSTEVFCDYDKKTIHKWLCVFTKRFFTQQFKRSCMPDGPKIGSVCLSPRADWRMPTDASYALWLKELEEIII